jgi:hypothetical protein
MPRRQSIKEYRMHPKMKAKIKAYASRKGKALASVNCSVTSVDGYRAAGIIVEKELDYAQAKKPRRWIGRKTSAYWQGYHDGLLLAHCQHALGEYPSFNVAAIKQTLSLNEKGQR